MSSENKVCKTTITPQGVTLEFTDGRTLVCDSTQLPPETITQAALFGIRRKITNSFADAKGNVAEAFASAQETWNQLTSGQWTSPRETTAGGGKAASDLVEAVMAITGKERGVVESKLDEMTKEQRAALRKNPQVDAKLLEIRAARARAKVGETPVDVGSMF
jgi:hypothetical protein